MLTRRAHHRLTPKRPVRRGEKLRFGIDVDGTISQAPRHFQRLINALLDDGDQVFIVTARSESRRRETEILLECMGIRYTELIMRPDEYPDDAPGYKVRVVREKQIHLMIDDDATNCWAIIKQTETLAAHMLPIAELPEARHANEQCGVDRHQGGIAQTAEGLLIHLTGLRRRR